MDDEAVDAWLDEQDERERERRERAEEDSGPLLDDDVDD